MESTRKYDESRARLGLVVLVSAEWSEVAATTTVAIAKIATVNIRDDEDEDDRLGEEANRDKDAADNVIMTGRRMVEAKSCG